MASTDIMAWLAGVGDYENSTTYKTITKYYSEADGKSLAMRLLVHYVGDFHQPLHLAEVVDKENPKGDLGGNTFNVDGKYGVNNLHSLWDSVLYAYHTDLSLVSTNHTLKRFN